VTPVEQIVEHARMMSHRNRHPESGGWTHGSIHDVILAHGRVFEPAPLPDNVYPALPGHAPKAAAILADQHALVYVEGLALLPDMRTVIEHAWCATFGGRVLDPNLGGDTAAAYLGVAFTMQFRRTRAADRWPILISAPGSDRARNFEILEHGLPSEAVLEIGKPLGDPGAASTDTLTGGTTLYGQSGSCASPASVMRVQTDGLATAA
jgi:hypothetical protein